MPENKDDIQNLKEENEHLKSELDAYKQRDEQHKNIRWWTARKFTGLVLGKDLKTSVKTVVNEVSEDKKVSKDALSDLITSLIKRITRVGAITILLALLPTLILLVQTWILSQQNKRIDTQNELVKNQNALIDKQNTRLDQQTYLQEAERRSSLVFLFSNIMDAIDKELKEDVGEKGKRDLSPQLIGRIVALSTRLKPYRYLDGDTLITKPLSPERGQLLVSLVRSNLDSTTLVGVYENADFSHSDLGDMNLSKTYLGGINLSNSDLKSANLVKSNLSGAKLKGINLKYAKLMGSNLNATEVDCEIRRQEPTNWEDKANLDFIGENYEMIYSMEGNAIYKDVQQCRCFLRKRFVRKLND